MGELEPLRGIQLAAPLPARMPLSINHAASVGRPADAVTGNEEAGRASTHNSVGRAEAI